MSSTSDITYFAKTNFRNLKQLFGIKQSDRAFHTYIIGKTGAGKTNLLKTKILQDIQNGRGCCLFDIHGDLIEEIQLQNWSRKKKEALVVKQYEKSHALAICQNDSHYSNLKKDVSRNPSEANGKN